MAAGAITTVKAITDAIGIKIKNPFKGSNPNKGNSSLVDAIDNYEGISSTRAKSMESQIVNLINSGASETKIAGVLASAGGYSTQEVLNSYKWDYMRNQIQKIRSQSANYSTAVTPSVFQQPKGLTDPSNPFLYVALAAAGLAGFFIYKNVAK